MTNDDLMGTINTDPPDYERARLELKQMMDDHGLTVSYAPLEPPEGQWRGGARGRVSLRHNDHVVLESDYHAGSGIVAGWARENPDIACTGNKWSYRRLGGRGAIKRALECPPWGRRSPSVSDAEMIAWLVPELAYRFRPEPVDVFWSIVMGAGSVYPSMTVDDFVEELGYEIGRGKGKHTIAGVTAMFDARRSARMTLLEIFGSDFEHLLEVASEI